MMRFTIYDLRFTLLAVLLATCHLSHATDLTTGYSFSSGEQNVTHTKLNNAVNLATINPGFYTDKSAVTSPSSSDLLLLYSQSEAGLRKITAGNFVLGNAALITGQSEDTSPSSADFLLTYDVSATALKKATALNLFFENAALIGSRTNWNEPDGDNFYLGYNGDWNKTARSNLWYQFWNYRTSDFTNLTVHTTPTNSDALVLWDSLSGTNRQIPLINLLSNLAPATSLGPTNVLAGVVGTNAATISLNTLSNYFRTNLASRFTVSGVSLGSGGSVYNAAHSLPGTPQAVRWVLVMGTTTENGYSALDELDVGAMAVELGGAQAFSWGANATNVWLTLNNSGTLAGRTKANGDAANFTPSRWTAKCYATYFP